MKKKMIAVILVLCAVAGVGYGANYLMGLNRYKKIISEIQLKDVDLSKVANGVYHGSCDAEVIGAEVDVTVKDNSITDINLKHKTDRGQSAEVLVDRVIEKQKINIDTISGATNSSKVILKAIENALENK